MFCIADDAGERVLFEEHLRRHQVKSEDRSGQSGVDTHPPAPQDDTVSSRVQDDQADEDPVPPLLCKGDEVEEEVADEMDSCDVPDEVPVTAVSRKRGRHFTLVKKLKVMWTFEYIVHVGPAAALITQIQ